MFPSITHPEWAFVPPLPTAFPRHPSYMKRHHCTTTGTRLPTPSPSPLPQTPTRLQLTRLRLHLLRATRLHAHDSPAVPDPRGAPPSSSRARPRPVYSPEERRARSDRLRAKWADPAWRAAMLARRREETFVERHREVARNLWADPEYRARMRAARIGRAAPNKGVPASDLTKLRMSMARKGLPFSEERKRKMSTAKLNRPDGDDWPRRISEGKKGKTKEYFQVRREFRALHRDLKLWSDSFRAQHGRLPSAATYEKFVAPMMVLRIKRYLTLRDAIGNDEPDVKKEIISRR